MNIEDLMNIKVSSVSRTEEKLSRTASAVFVITQEDIRRSGALNIPDLLRMVPGVDVGQINANTWAIAVRGFNSRFSNKLMVLLDGRRLYIPTTGGVFWDVVDVPLEDIERIEVIRGPGGSVWGANAVEGVINIITKKAAETSGGLVSAGGGNLAQGFGTVQYGGNLDKGKMDYRVYTKYQDNDHLPNATGQNGGDGWHLLDGGFRTDSALSDKDNLTTQGSMYTGEEDIPTFTLPSLSSPSPVFVDTPVNLSGGYLQSVWNHTFSARTDTTLEVSYDSYRRNDTLREGRETLYVDFQHHIAVGTRQDIRWGLTYEYTDSDTDGGLLFSVDPADLSASLFGCFVQDEIVLVPERLYLTVGTKLEHNNYTGWAAMPGTRIAWQPNKKNMIWAALSRAVHTPNETDIAARQNFAGFVGPGGLPAVAGIAGNPDYRNEELVATEAGYRASVSDRISFGVAAFYNHYTHQQTLEPGTPFLEAQPPPLHLFIPSLFANLMHGEAHGFEISSDWKVMNRWSLSPGYAFEQVNMHAEPGSLDTTSAALNDGISPRHSAQLRSRVDLSHGLAWDAAAYFVGRLPGENIPAYTRIDTQLTWEWSERGTVSLVGQNLQRDHHLEFEDFLQSIVSSQTKRSGYAMIRWRF